MVGPHRSREEFWQWNIQNFLRFAGSRLNQNDSLLAKFQWSGGAIQSAGPELLEMILGNQQWSWDTYLPPLGMSVRSKVNRNTGFTPNFLRLGREVHIQMWCLECRWRWKVTKSQQTMHDNWSTNWGWYRQRYVRISGGAEASENVLWRQCLVERVRGGRFGLPNKGCLEAWIEQEALSSVHRSVLRHQGVVSLSISGGGLKTCLGMASW